MGKPLTPKAVVFVPDLPKTRNAKVMRRVLRAAWLDEPPGDLSALVNPEIVDVIRQAGSARRDVRLCRKVELLGSYPPADFAR